MTDKAVFEPPAAPSGGAIEPDARFSSLAELAELLLGTMNDER